MKLYEVNQAIENLLWQLEPDPETGEVPINTEELCVQLDALQLEHSKILEYLAKLVLNLRSNAAALREEEKRLAERRHSFEKREERIMKILDREAGGENTNCGVATITYHPSVRVNVLDCKKAVNWLKRHKLIGCYRTPDPEINKNDVKKLMKSGTKIPGLELVQDKSCSLN